MEEQNQNKIDEEFLATQMKMWQLFAPTEKQCIKVLNNWCLVLGGDKKLFSQKDVNEYIENNRPLIQLIFGFYLFTSDHFFKNCCPEDWDDTFKKGIIQKLGQYLGQLNSNDEKQYQILLDIGYSIYKLINTPMKIYKNEDQFNGVWFKMMNYWLESKEKLITEKQQE